jgi:hypothetical protein
MQPDDILAVGMILLFLSTLVVIIAYGRRPLNTIVPRRLAMGIPAGFIAFSMLNRYALSCEVTGLPTLQSLLASLCLVSIIFLVGNKWITISGSIVILIAGYQLCTQYNDLVNRAGSYAYIDPPSGLAYNYACPTPWSPSAIKAKPLWHSAFTDVYGAEQVK